MSNYWSNFILLQPAQRFAASSPRVFFPSGKAPCAFSGVADSPFGLWRWWGRRFSLGAGREAARSHAYAKCLKQIGRVSFKRTHLHCTQRSAVLARRPAQAPERWASPASSSYAPHTKCDGVHALLGAI